MRSEDLVAIVVAGTHSGVGKTTVTLGLIGALRRRGLSVQPFKVGPDFIDPLHHRSASGRPPRNLDDWMLSPEANRERFARASDGADAVVVEGVMGLFDGSEGGSDRGSTAAIAKLLGLPVLLVVDAGAMARSAAALIHGFASFDPELEIAGVILNNVAGDAHAEMIRDALAGGVEVVGALPRDPGLTMPERHLGLQLPHEARGDHLSGVTALVEAHVDVAGLVARSVVERPRASAAPRALALRVRIALARDEAFCFYYEDNLEELSRAGAELVDFSPLRERPPDGVDGLYLGGGYPELHAARLADNAPALAAVRTLAARGAPIYAECGGLMYLGRTLEHDGEVHDLCGVLPFATRMGGFALSYIEVETTGGLFGAGLRARGHCFHHSQIVGEPAPELERCYRVTTPRGGPSEEGYRVGGVLASYAHLHFASEPRLADAFVARCAQRPGTGSGIAASATTATAK